MTEKELAAALKDACDALYRASQMLDAICMTDTSRDRRHARDRANEAWLKAARVVRDYEVSIEEARS